MSVPGLREGGYLWLVAHVSYNSYCFFNGLRVRPIVWSVALGFQ